MYSQAVRVATTNNFNCTSAEWAQLWTFEQKHPDKLFFINANIKTPKLNTINHHNNRIVITLNPDLTPPDPKHLASLARLNPDRIAFLRIKYVPDWPDIKELICDFSKKYPVVITLQRFNGKKNLLKYTRLEHYQFECSRYRLHGQALNEITSLVDSLAQSGKPVWICDRKGLGCQGCGICPQLASGYDIPVTSLNLSSSGLCPYNCPDCYAKTMQNFSRKLGHKPIIYDKIMQNHKQAGRTEHIKRVSKESL